ncbi:hypothetical protein V501_04352 [Pseudogymnoascus sp. VKM F-4519 (FW-2642)]|nr:hypothetical protein V501_04352 [Pseudogymnoascus sp. VKM F-4519 (FW-2642)]
MDAITTPIKSNTDTTTEPIWTSELVTSTESMPQGDNIVSPTDGPFTPSRRRISSTLSTGSSNTSTSSTSSSQFNDYSSGVGTPLTPPSTEDAEFKGQNPIQYEDDLKGKDSEQSIGEILQTEHFEGNRGADQRHSTPQPEKGVIEFGSDFVYGYKFSLVAAVGHKSPTPKNVSRQDLNTEGEQHSAKPEEPDVTSNDSETHLETEDKRLEDSRSSKEARRDGASLSPARSLSEDVHLHLANGLSRGSSPSRSAIPYPKSSLEPTASIITSSPEAEVVGSLSNNVGAPSHNSGKRAPKKANGLTPQEDLRRSPRIQKLNHDKASASATSHADAKRSYFAHYATDEEPSQNSGEEVCDLDEHEAITDEYQASMTSGQAPGPVAQEPNSDTEAAEVVQPPINATKRPDMDAAKRAGGIEFKQHKEMKSPSEVKAEILGIILQGDKEDRPGFVYIYKVKGSDGHVKIGKSRQKHGKRLNQWKAQCKLKPERISDPNHKILQYYGMVEKLAQMELSDKRKTYQCDVCRKGGRSSPKDEYAEHEEWFEVTEEHALEVVERWRGWLVQHQPYGLDGTLLGIWEWKHNKLSKANTVDFEEWVILTRSDEYAYAWHRIDDHLQKELKKPILRSSLAINAALVAVTSIWFVSGAFFSSVSAMVILFMFLKYSS